MKNTALIITALLLTLMAYSQQTNDEVLSEAAGLLQQKCFVCHSPTADHDNRLAPPMEAVKMHYLRNYSDKDAFVSAVNAFVKNPNEEDALLFGAVRRFNVMPKQEFDEEEVKAIAAFIYENDLETPEWFADQHPNGMQHGKGNGKGMGHGKHKGQGGCTNCDSGQCKHHSGNH
jgi:hypothetical protein